MTSAARGLLTVRRDYGVLMMSSGQVPRYRETTGWQDVAPFQGTIAARHPTPVVDQFAGDAVYLGPTTLQLVFVPCTMVVWDAIVVPFMSQTATSPVLVLCQMMSDLPSPSKSWVPAISQIEGTAF